MRKMWLLKFHISVCILCWIAVRAMKIIFSDKYKRYQCKKKAKLSERIMTYICPIVNVMLVLGLLYMAFAPDEFVEEMNRRKK